MVTSFNEPLNIMGPDFTARWESLTAPGLQQQEIFNPQNRISPQNVMACLTQVDYLYLFVCIRRVFNFISLP